MGILYGISWGSFYGISWGFFYGISWWFCMGFHGDFVWDFMGILYGISWDLFMGFHGDFVWDLMVIFSMGFHGDFVWDLMGIFFMGCHGDFFMGFHGDFVWDLMVIFHGIFMGWIVSWKENGDFHQNGDFINTVASWWFLLWINMVFLWDFNGFHQHFWYRGVSESGDFSKHPENLHFSENDDQPVDGTGYDIFRATFDTL